jgi:hypothetical protein
MTLKVFMVQRFKQADIRRCLLIFTMRQYTAAALARIALSTQ